MNKPSFGAAVHGTQKLFDQIDIRHVRDHPDLFPPHLSRLEWRTRDRRGMGFRQKERKRLSELILMEEVATKNERV